MVVSSCVVVVVVVVVVVLLAPPPLVVGSGWATSGSLGGLGCAYPMSFLTYQMDSLRGKIRPYLTSTSAMAGERRGKGWDGAYYSAAKAMRERA